jgi:tetratricopeptide (TPR) repeat protein
MRHIGRPARLALALLAGGAANDFGQDDAPGTSRFAPTGAFGAYLSGRFATQQGDLDVAADQLEAALTQSAGVSEVANQAFVAAVMAGRPSAARLAVGAPDNAVAGLVLADRDARSENWEQAEARFTDLPRQGLTQILRPLLIAWAEQGAGHTAAALAELQPTLDERRFRGVTALHAALIADLGGLKPEADRLYQTAQVEYGGLNMRLGQILASWQARQGNVDEARRTLRDMVGANGDMALARPALERDVAERPVRNAADGLAETYLAMAATLRQQNANDSAQVLLRLALDLRPDFTAARLLLADIQEAGKRTGAALETLASVPSSDPLAAVVTLRRASLLDSMGQEEAASRMLEALAQQYPDRPEPLEQIADSLRRHSRYAEAVVVYDRAVARVGTPTRVNWPLFYERGVALERAGEWPRAEADFEYALQLAPDQPNVLNYLGYAWVEQGRNVDRARRMIERAVEQRPNDGAFVDSLGWALLRQGDTAGALKNLERAVELQPEDPTINAHFGDVLDAVGRRREAEFQWRRALNLNPEPDDQARIETKLRNAEATQTASPAQTAGPRSTP